jgi:UDP-N-acetylglucosamine transferase subunit ALG13
VIFVTVGNQLPFDRLIRAVDQWAATSVETPVVAQIGDAGTVPSHCKSVRSVDAQRYHELMGRASHVIAHAGMGTVLTARRLGKPLLVMPRQSCNGEVRSDHQQATCRYLEGLPGVCVAWDEVQLLASLPAFLASSSPQDSSGDSSAELVRLQKFVQDFVLAGRKKAR